MQPELTRTEYLRLLTTARALDKERLYLLVKLFGCTGIPVQELPRVTVAALSERCITVRSSGTVQLLHLPDFLRKELQAYARREGIASGPLFRTKSGSRWAAPPSRTASSSCAGTARYRGKSQSPAFEAAVQSTQDGIRTQIDLLVEQACDRLMEAEQLTVGWDVGKGVSDV